ncbi:MAG: hypothetical protein KF842_12080 [Caulobacter sp.]|nr:hypothetical protein [Caulobacter sp.]
MDDDKPESDKSEPDKLHTFVVETVAAPDILMRVLAPFAVQEAMITDIRIDHLSPGLSIAIEAAGVSEARAALIGRRLEALAAVRAVGRGWRGLPPA